MLKLGFILYGITRDQANVTAPIFNKLIVSPLRDFFNITIFLHTLILEECEIDWAFNNNTKKIQNSKDYTLYSPDYSSSTNQSVWSNSFDYDSLICGAPNPYARPEHTNSKNHINALYSLSQSFKHTQKSPCDLYFISRLDLLYQNNEGLLDSCLDISKHLKNNILYSPNWGLNGGLNDRFAICNHIVAKTYCNRFSSYIDDKAIIKNGVKCGLNIHAESMLKRCSEKHGWQNKNFPCKAYRIRIDGSTRKFEFEI